MPNIFGTAADIFQAPSKALGALGESIAYGKAPQLQPGSDWNLNAPTLGEFTVQGISNLANQLPPEALMMGIPSEVIGGLLPENFRPDNPYVQSGQEIAEQIGGLGLEGLAGYGMAGTPGRIAKMLGAKKYTPLQQLPQFQGRRATDLLSPMTTRNMGRSASAQARYPTLDMTMPPPAGGPTGL